MDEKLITIRSKKLGLFIRQVRENCQQTVDNCAFWLNLNREDFQAVETGEKALSLPQLESLSAFLHTPFKELVNGPADKKDTENISSREMNLNLIQLRDRVIAAMMKENRQNKNISLEELSEKSGLSLESLQDFENAVLPIPYTQLEGLASILEIPLESLFSSKGPFKHGTIANPVASEAVSDIPAALQEFYAKPVNLPYLELAMKLSKMDADKLRTIAASLLEITY